ncbi:MAG TPA: RusA family crossover junction endodeoxyribonuclease [Methylomirabilota bacterium]
MFSDRLLPYLYDEAALDADNILEPIQDALIGIVLDDDSVITDIEAWPSAGSALH